MINNVGATTSKAEMYNWGLGGNSSFATITVSKKEFTVLYFDINGYKTINP